MSHLLTISDAVAARARLAGEKIGARDSRRAITYAQWNDRASRLANGLLGLGLRKGDRVAVLAYNCMEWMEIYVGLARAGLVAVPLNFRLSMAEIAYIVGDAEAACLIAGSEFREGIDSIRADLSIPSNCFVLLDQQPAANWLGYERLMEQHEPDGAQDIAVSPEDPCALLYTSGTTGRPKGAIRSHAGSALIAMATALEMCFTSDDTALLVMPMCHANSLYFANTFMHIGGTCVIDDRRSFDPEAFLSVMARERVTFTSLVPTHYIMILALPEAIKNQYDMSKVGKLMISSAPARKSTKLAILEYFKNGKLYELYGATETGWVTLLRPDEQLVKLGSVGREWATSGAIRILDEEGNEVPDGEVGELFSRTSYVFDGYWKNPEKTAQAFRGEWCSVGDLARRDSDGYIWLVDRKSNMIISGGENIYPSEVEGVISGHPAVKDVAVIGVPDEKWGETVLAAVVLHDGQTASADEIQAWCKQRLAGFKTPRVVKFIADTDMPRTGTGKVLHRALRQQIEASNTVPA